ncbi:fibrinogen-like protein 1 [Watersipora subatra]|uniref:fibrinogen-like protein 1 n=1 Tax=Watersipora subatra TaxID=2589382 RepID=UPI00355C5F4A
MTANRKALTYNVGVIQSEPDSKIHVDCQDAFEKGERQSGEVYYLSPPAKAKAAVKAVCIFDGFQGWNLIQRRINGTTSFNQSYHKYHIGFGDMRNEYWIGLLGMRFLSLTNKFLTVHLESHDGEWRTANYSNFYIDGYVQNYTAHIEGYSGDAGDALLATDNSINGQQFSAYDKDNDASDDENCAAKYQGGFWYNNCSSSSINGPYQSNGTIQRPGLGMTWTPWKGPWYSLKTVYILLGR